MAWRVCVKLLHGVLYSPATSGGVASHLLIRNTAKLAAGLHGQGSKELLIDFGSLRFSRRVPSGCGGFALWGSLLLCIFRSESPFCRPDSEFTLNGVKGPLRMTSS